MPSVVGSIKVAQAFSAAGVSRPADFGPKAVPPKSLIIGL